MELEVVDQVFEFVGVDVDQMRPDGIDVGGDVGRKVGEVGGWRGVGRGGGHARGSLKQQIECFGEGLPGFGAFLQVVATIVVEAVVLAVWPFVGRFHIGGQLATAVQPAQGAVDRGVADLLETGIPQGSHDVVAVGVAGGEHRQHRKVEHSFEEL